MMPVYHDVYIENVTHRKQNGMGKVTFYISVVMAVLWFVFGLVNRGAFLVCFLFAGLAIYIRLFGEKDYEINYTNGELDIDVIFAKSRRKNLVSINVEDIVVLAKSKTDPVKKYIGASMKTMDCISHEEGVPYYCMIYKNRDKDTEEKVLFEPGDELLDELSRRLHGRVYK